MNHRGKHGRNHEYQDSNDSASTPDTIRSHVSPATPQIYNSFIENVAYEVKSRPFTLLFNYPNWYNLTAALLRRIYMQ